MKNIHFFFGSYAIAEHINGENIYFNEAQYAILCAKREVIVLSILPIGYYLILINLIQHKKMLLLII